MEIGTKIRKLRELKGLSQENLAEELNLSVNGYGKIERNEVSVSYDRLLSISKVLEVPVETIVGFDNKYIYHNDASKNQGELVFHQENGLEELRTLYDRLIKAKDEEILFLRNLLKEKE